MTDLRKAIVVNKDGCTGALDNASPLVLYKPGDDTIRLVGRYTAKELRCLANWMTKGLWAEGPL